MFVNADDCRSRAPSHSGFIEHRARYINLFPLFAQANIGITAFDQRGYGETWTKHPTPNKAHGNTTWNQQFQDVEDLVRIERKRLDDKYGASTQVPIYLMGHSMVSREVLLLAIPTCPMLRREKCPTGWWNLLCVHDAGGRCGRSDERGSRHGSGGDSIEPLDQAKQRE